MKECGALVKNRVLACSLEGGGTCKGNTKAGHNLQYVSCVAISTGHLNTCSIIVSRLISASLNVCAFQIWTVPRRIRFAISNFATCAYEY